MRQQHAAVSLVLDNASPAPQKLAPGNRARRRDSPSIYLPRATKVDPVIALRYE
jgi:hypothetical protein